MIEEQISHALVEVGNQKYTITYCDLFDVDQNVLLATGISVCCPKDQYDRKKGNLIARNRANKAWKEIKSSSPVRRNNVLAFLGYDFKCISFEND